MRPFGPFVLPPRVAPEAGDREPRSVSELIRLLALAREAATPLAALAPLYRRYPDIAPVFRVGTETVVTVGDLRAAERFMQESQ